MTAAQSMTYVVCNSVVIEQFLEAVFAACLNAAGNNLTLPDLWRFGKLVHAGRTVKTRVNVTDLHGIGGPGPTAHATSCLCTDSFLFRSLAFPGPTRMLAEELCVCCGVCPEKILCFSCLCCLITGKLCETGHVVLSFSLPAQTEPCHACPPVCSLRTSSGPGFSPEAAKPLKTVRFAASTSQPRAAKRQNRQLRSFGAWQHRISQRPGVASPFFSAGNEYALRWIDSYKR